MKKVWVVVANQCEMKIYRAQNAHHLVLHSTLLHDEGHLQAHELISDRQGCYRGIYGSDGLQEKTATKVKEAARFAHQIAHVLEEACNKQECERIYLIVEHVFIDILRQALKPVVTKLVAQEILKNVVHAKEEQIRDYLPPVL